MHVIGVSPVSRPRAWRPAQIVLLVAGCVAGCRTPGPTVPAVPTASKRTHDAPRDEVRRAGLGETAAKVATPPKPTVLDADDPELDPPPTTLAEAIAFGLEHNPRLRQASARASVAAEDREIAFAPFLPDINFSYVFAGYNIPVLPANRFVPAALQSGVYAYSLAEFGIQYTIYDFGRRAGNYDREAARARYQALMLDRARQTISYDVASAYFRLLEARAEVRVREESVRQAIAIREDTEARLRGGTTERERVLRSEVEVARTGEELAASRQAILDAEALLNLALGRRCGPLPIADLARWPPYRGTLEQALERAASTRPEIGAAREEIAGARSGEVAARAEFLPKIYTRGTVLRADSQRNLHGWVDGAGIHADQPLYQGGRRSAAVRRAGAETGAAMAGLRQILDDVSAQVNIAHNAIATDRERIALSGRAAGQARENLRIVMIRYNNGDAIPTEVVDAQTALTAAEVRFYRASYAYLDDLARLEYAQGGNQCDLLEAASKPPEGDDEQIGLPEDARDGRAIPPASPPPGAPPPSDDTLPPALPDGPA